MSRADTPLDSKLLTDMQNPLRSSFFLPGAGQENVIGKSLFLSF